MKPDDLRSVTARLFLSAPDMKGQTATHVAALTSECGKLFAGCAKFEAHPETEEIGKSALLRHGGAIILIVASLLQNFDLDLATAIQAGERELQR